MGGVIKIKFMCMTCGEAKPTETLAFKAEKGLLVQKVPTGWTRGLSQIHLAGWNARFIKVKKKKKGSVRFQFPEKTSVARFSALLPSCDCHWRSVCVVLKNKLINHGLVDSLTSFSERAKGMVEAFDCLLRAKVTDWLRISWSAPAVFKTFRTCSSLLCSLPSLISNSFSPLFGTQGRSRRLQSLFL